MIKISEMEITKEWGSFNVNNPLVSIRCITFNHEKFISKCLDGFLMQKTNFPFEIVIHDDASTDKTAQIIHEYESKYPNIIKAIYETENQYSKKDGSIKKIIDAALKGKYIAFCEGDDYWCDEHKLQFQYDFMEKNTNCSMCVHNTKIFNLKKNKTEGFFSKWTNIHKLNGYEVFMGWNVHTSSFFIKRDDYNLPSFKKIYWFGDYVLLTYLYTKGDVCYLPQIMSVYNSQNVNGITERINSEKTEKGNPKKMLIIDYLNELNELTCNKYEIYIKERVEETYFLNNVYINSEIIRKEEKKETVIQAAKKIINHYYYKKYTKRLSLKKRLKFIYKFQGYRIYKIWKYIWMKKIK